MEYCLTVVKLYLHIKLNDESIIICTVLSKYAIFPEYLDEISRRNIKL